MLQYNIAEVIIMKREQKETSERKNKAKKVLIISIVETTKKGTVFGAGMKPDGQITCFEMLSLGEEDPGEWLFCGF